MDGMSMYSGYFVPKSKDPSGTMDPDAGRAQRSIYIIFSGRGGLIPNDWQNVFGHQYRDADDSLGGREHGGVFELDSTEVDKAENILLEFLDTDKDGDIDDQDCPIRIKTMGYSWGGTSSVHLAWRLKINPAFVGSRKSIYVGTLDPVSTARSPEGLQTDEEFEATGRWERVYSEYSYGDPDGAEGWSNAWVRTRIRASNTELPSNVIKAINYYQTNGLFSDDSGFWGRGFDSWYRGNHIVRAENHDVSNAREYDRNDEERYRGLRGLSVTDRIPAKRRRLAPDHLDMASSVYAGRVKSAVESY